MDEYQQKRPAESNKQSNPIRKKRALSGYSIYSFENKDSMKKKILDQGEVNESELDIIEVYKAIGRKWRVLPDEEKSIYKERAKIENVKAKNAQ